MNISLHNIVKAEVDQPENIGKTSLDQDIIVRRFTFTDSNGMKFQISAFADKQEADLILEQK